MGVQFQDEETSCIIARLKNRQLLVGDNPKFIHQILPSADADCTCVLAEDPDTAGGARLRGNDPAGARLGLRDCARTGAKVAATPAMKQVKSQARGEHETATTLNSAEAQQMEEFCTKWGLLQQRELRESCCIELHDIQRCALELVECSGCRSSMESLLATLAQRASTSTATLGPFAVQSDRSVKLQDTLLNCKAGSAARVYDSLREAGADSADGPACSPLFRSLPKNGRGNRRCVLHSRRPPSASSWIEVWLVMNEQCRTALLRLSTASVEDALREYPSGDSRHQS